MKKIGKYRLVLLGLVVSISARSQNPFQQQIDRYPQEKLHVTTDKDDYILGDTVWLRVHCVDAATHRPVGASRYVYVELRTPDGDLHRRIKLLNRDDAYSGYFPTQGLEREGDYTLTAYTMYMRNQGPEYFFTRARSTSSRNRLRCRPTTKRGNVAEDRRTVASGTSRSASTRRAATSFPAMTAAWASRRRATTVARLRSGVC